MKENCRLRSICWAATTQNAGDTHQATDRRFTRRVSMWPKRYRKQKLFPPRRSSVPAAPRAQPVVRHLSVLIWNFLRDGVEYREHGLPTSPKPARRRALKLLKELKALGYASTATPQLYPAWLTPTPELHVV